MSNTTLVLVGISFLLVFGGINWATKGAFYEWLGKE